MHVRTTNKDDNYRKAIIIQVLYTYMLHSFTFMHCDLGGVMIASNNDRLFCGRVKGICARDKTKKLHEEFRPLNRFPYIMILGNMCVPI